MGSGGRGGPGRGAAWNRGRARHAHISPCIKSKQQQRCGQAAMSENKHAGATFGLANGWRANRRHATVPLSQQYLFYSTWHASRKLKCPASRLAHFHNAMVAIVVLPPASARQSPTVFRTSHSGAMFVVIVVARQVAWQ